MYRWFMICAAVGLGGLALAADPPPPAGPAKTAEPARKEAVPEADQGEGVSLTVYNQDFVVVKDRRKVDLTKGRAALRFRDVAATIVPETVQFATLRQPDLARVAEQNYEFDLVSADKLLDKYIDRAVAVVTRDGETVKGTLLSFDENQLVLKTDRGVDLVPRGTNVKDVQFGTLPGGLLTRPTLVWQLDAKETGKELVKVAYRADKMTWRVDYRARVDEAGTKMDLAGWVTVTNNTGTGYRDAQVKLMAGDVHVVQEKAGLPHEGEVRELGKRKSGAAPQFGEKSFAEYHLYELNRKTTLKDRETKQIELLDVEGIPVQRKYVYRGEGNKVAVALEVKNDEKVREGLGIPLPKGPVRVYQKDVDGRLEFSGTDSIDHTPRNEPVQVRLGYAFDVVGERKELAQRGVHPQIEQDWEVRLRNHKTEPVTVDVVEPIQGHTNWSMLRQSHQFVQRDVNTLVFPIEVKPNAEVVLTYTIRYNW
jgi:hypothetical protein